MTAGSARWMGVIAAAVALAAAPISRATADPVLAAAGDLPCTPRKAANASTCQQQATASLVAANNPTAVAVLGDNQYENGTLAEYTGTGAFDQTWGAFKPTIHPAPGNHEYGSDGKAAPDGYFAYFGGAAGAAGKGWYSYDLGVWHVVVLNSSNDCAPVSCAAGSDQEKWLKADLDAHPGQCTLAYWHHPRFSSGNIGDAPAVQPFWDDLYAVHADVVLNGHEHLYERFKPQDPTGIATTAGIREFIAGTGGRSLFGFNSIEANSEVHDDTHFGALFLTLHQGSYDWTFKGIDGTQVDSGSSACRYQPPAAVTGDPSSLSDAGAGVSGSVNPQGDPTSYRFDLGTSTSYGTSTTDQTVGADSTVHSVSAALSGLAASTTYHYRLVARSPAGTSFGADRTFTTAAPPAPALPPSPQVQAAPQLLPVPSVPRLVAAASLVRVQRLAAVLRRGLGLRLSCSAPCAMRIALSIGRVSSRSTSAGRLTLRLPAGSHRSVRVKLSSRARRLLARARSARIAVRLDAVAGSRTWRSTRSVSLRR